MLTRRLLSSIRRYSTIPTDAGEKQIYTKLTEALQPSKLTVKDVSGGCGSAYAVEVSSEKFTGLSMIKQQRMVNQILKEEIANMHAYVLMLELADDRLQLKTSAT